MGRKFFAIIDTDEDIKSKYEETNGLDEATPGDYLEREFGWLEQSGISLEDWMIMDENDELKWARYINYLVKWAFDHHCEEFEDMSPASYKEWVACEGSD